MQRGTPLKKLGKSAPTPASPPSELEKLRAKNPQPTRPKPQGPFFTERQQQYHLGIFADTATTKKKEPPVENKQEANLSAENKGESKALPQVASATPSLRTAPASIVKHISHFLNSKDHLSALRVCRSLNKSLNDRPAYRAELWIDFRTELKPDHENHLSSFFKKHFPNQIDIPAFIKKLHHRRHTLPWEALCMLTTEFKDQDDEKVSALERGFQKKLLDEKTAHVHQFKSATETSTPLMLTVCYGNLRGLEFLVEEKKQDPKKVQLTSLITGPGPDGGLRFIGHSLLHLAAAYGQIDILDYLINDCGMDKNTPTADGTGMTPFMIAAKHNRVGTMRHLIKEHKIDPHQVTCVQKADERQNALHVAITASRKTDAVKFLRDECDLSIYIDDRLPTNFFKTEELINASHYLIEHIGFLFDLNDEILTAELRKAFKDYKLILSGADGWHKLLASQRQPKEETFSAYLQYR